MATEPTDETPDGTELPTNTDDDEIDPDSPEAAWQDFDISEDGKAATDPVVKELSNGKRVRVTEPTDADMSRYRDRVRNRARGPLSDEDLAELVVIEMLKEHYHEPSFDGLTQEIYSEKKLGFFDKFVEAIAGDIDQVPGNR